MHIRRTKMKTAVYSGSFDPITEGHLDIIRRAANIFDEVIVSVLINPSKTGLFNIEERVGLIKKVTKDIKNVKVESFHGLLVDYMKNKNAKVIIKGLRAVSDFEYELQMAQMNKKLDASIETVFMMTDPKYSYLSSSSIKQVVMFGGCIKGMVPEQVRYDVINKINKVR